MPTIQRIRHRATRAWERELENDLLGHRVMLLARLVDKISQRCQAITLAGEQCRNLAEWPGRACSTHRRAPPTSWVSPARKSRLPRGRVPTDEERAAHLREKWGPLLRRLAAPATTELSDGEADAMNRVMGGGL